MRLWPAWQPSTRPSITISGRAAQVAEAGHGDGRQSQNENATATLGGTLSAPKPKAAASKKKTVSLEPVSVPLQPGVPVSVDIAVAKPKLIKKSLKAGKKPKGTVTATASDDLGGTASAAVDVKYKKKKK